jgi:signal transduction histidine kinase
VSDTAGSLAIRIHDNGIGGVPEDALTALRDRVSAVGGQLEFTSPRGGGTEIRAVI